MLPVIEPDGRRTGRQAVLYAAALVPVSLAPTLVGVTGPAYFWSRRSVSASALLWLAVRFARSRTDATARALFFGSITYLPLIWMAMIAEQALSFKSRSQGSEMTQLRLQVRADS